MEATVFLFWVVPSSILNISNSLSIYLDSWARDHGKSAVIWIFREFSNFHSDRHRLCSSSSCISRLRISKFKMAAILSTLLPGRLSISKCSIWPQGTAGWRKLVRNDSSWSCLWCLEFRWFPISIPQFRAHVIDSSSLWGYPVHLQVTQA